MFPSIFIYTSSQTWYLHVYMQIPIPLRQLMEVGVGKVVQGPKGYAIVHHRCSQYFFC